MKYMDGMLFTLHCFTFLLALRSSCIALLIVVIVRTPLNCDLTLDFKNLALIPHS